MIARANESDGSLTSGPQLWAALAAPLPAGCIEWRQDGKPVARDGRWIARFVAYIDAHTVRERLDAVCPGEWDVTLALLPQGADDDGVVECAFKARMQILGVIREDVGTGKDYKSAATDAYKRAAVRFGIGHELYAMDPLWVPVDGDGKFAKPLEDPGTVYARRNERSARAPETEARERTTEPAQNGAAAVATNGRPTARATSDEPACPVCGGRMWNNTLSKRNPRAPNFKCRDRGCKGCIWPDERQPDVIAADGRPEFAEDDFDPDVPY